MLTPNQKAPPRLPHARGARFSLWLSLAIAVAFSGATAGARSSDPAPRLEELHHEALQRLEESRKNNPKLFGLIQQRNAIAAENFLNDPLQDLDLSRIVGQPYSNYDSRAWAFASVGYALFNAGLCYASSDNKWYRNPALLAKSEAGFEWMLRQVSDRGTLGAPDRNIDRFAYCPSWEAFVLLGQELPASLRERFSSHLQRAAEYQQNSYGKKAGRYPNMDSAYILIMQQAASLFDRPDFRRDADMGLERLANCMSGSTWQYIINDEAKWNPTPGYTQIVLQYLGRTWQLSQNPKALQQIEQVAEYYHYYIEPGGLMDNGSAPHIKHDWAAPWVASLMGLELVRCYTPSPDPVLQTFADGAHDALLHQAKGLHTRWMIYWLAPDSGRKEAPPAIFTREAPEIAGFQARVTNESGTLTVYATGRESARDTRVSAIVSGKEGNTADNAALTGVFVEYIKDGVSYFMGDMKPAASVSVEPARQTARMTVTQGRQSMGSEAKPLPFGNFMGSIKTWTQDCWHGGIPNANPVATTESWQWERDHLQGTVSVKALHDTAVDEIRITLPFLYKRIDEIVTIPGRAAARSGHLCVAITGIEGSWESPDAASLKSSGLLVLAARAPTDGILHAGDTLSADITIQLGQSLSP